MFAARLMCSWIGSLGLAAGAFGQTYVPISIPPFDIAPTSINTAGTVVGYFGFSDVGQFHGFARDPEGNITTFDPPGSADTQVLSINAAGAITGFYLAGLLVHGFVRDPAGNFTSFDVPVPGATERLARSINARGAVTGFYYIQNMQNAPIHGFLRGADGTITLFDPPGSTQTVPESINNAGAITGYYADVNDYHGFLRDPSGNITSFDPPLSTGTYAGSINYAGAITGSYVGANGRDYGFVRDASGTITSFDPGFNTLAGSINSQGVIAGAYFDSQFTTKSGFLRSPGGTITLLDPPSFRTGFVTPTSINEGGVVTGDCLMNGTHMGWVRFP